MIGQDLLIVVRLDCGIQIQNDLRCYNRYMFNPLTADHILKCYSQNLCGGSAKNFRFWLFCTDLVAN